MAQETWLVVAVAAGFLLLGIAASPLGLGGPACIGGPAADRERERSFAGPAGAVARVAGPAGALRGGAARIGARRGRRGAPGLGGLAVVAGAGAIGQRAGGRVAVRTARSSRSSPAHRGAQPGRRPGPPGDARRAEPALCGHLGPRRFRGLARRHRPGDRSADRADRADPGPPAPVRRQSDQYPPCLTRMIPDRAGRGLAGGLLLRTRAPC